MVACLHGTDRLSVGLGSGSCSARGDRGRSQPRSEARGAGADHPGVGGDGCRRRGRAARRGQPTGGVALAAAASPRHGVEGLLRDTTRKPGKAPLGGATVHRVVTLTCAEPPGEATHWTGRAMAKRRDQPVVRRAAHLAGPRLQPHRVRTFKRSNDPDFVTKLEDIVGLYVDPPQHAMVLSVDEKCQIQALDRTQPGLPIKPGKAGTTASRPAAIAEPSGRRAEPELVVAKWQAPATRPGKLSCALQMEETPPCA